MENKLSKTLLVIALGTVAVWIVFRAKEALAAEPKTITKIVPIPAEPKEPEWYTTAQKAVSILKQIGGLFKREDQIVKETAESGLTRKLGL